jgi:hypothetical protein
MENKLDGKGLRLRKSRLTSAVLLSTLMLISILFGVVQTSGAEGLVINEFMANNDEAVAGPDNNYPDWIELYNGGAESVDLSGMYLSNDLANPKWQFPTGTVLEAGSFRVVWCTNSSIPKTGYVDFNLNAQGEFICLLADDAETLIDSITFAGQEDDISFGRLPDGSSSWDYLTPTPGSANRIFEPETEGPTHPVWIPENIFINEFMANNDEAVLGPDGDYPDWIEVYNGGTESVDLGGMYLSDDLANPDAWQFPFGTVIEAGGFLVVWADNSSYPQLMHASFALNATGEAVCLFASDAETLIDSIEFTEQLDDVSYGRLPDGASNWIYLMPTPSLPNELPEAEAGVHEEPISVSEVPVGLVINEFMADNDITIAGPDGNYPDWIELYNAGNVSVDLDGMYLTDNLGNPTKWQFSDDTIIEPGGYLFIWADNASDQGSLHTSFALNANGEEIALFACDGETLIDSVVFTKQLGDVSYGRMPDGASNWEHLLSATPGWGNNKRQFDSESSLWSVLLLVGLVGVVCVLFVAINKLNARRR